MGAGLGNEKGISAPGYHIPAAGFINYDNIDIFYYIRECCINPGFLLIEV